MNLSKDLISQFVKATKDTTTVKKESTVYGTVVKYNEKTYVKIDGSDLLTPAETLSSVEDGERVSIMIKDHTATITGNYTAPSASSIKVDGMDADLKANTASIKNLVAKNAEIENLVASKATIDDLQAANAEIDTLKSNYAEIETLVADKASIGDLEAVNADIKSLKADKADIAHLEANYATIGSLNAVYADVTRLEANKADITDLTATNAVIEELKANKANISDLEANYATIKQLDATNANVTNLQAETANINKALIDKANISDLTATNANVSNLQATKADITDLNAANANINTLTGNLADITTLVNGNLTSDNIQSMVITGDKFTVADAFIKDAMIDSVNANKINAGVINTNNVSIQSNDGSMLLQGNLQQFKDKNGKVRIQIGKDATGNFTFVLYDENGTGQLINQNGIQSSNAIADGLIVDAKVADNANIAGSKLDIDSVVTEVNNGTTSIKGTKIYLDDQKQSLNVAFNNMSTTVSGNTSTIESHTTSINTMNGKVTQLISDTTITKQDGTTTSLKDAYNATVDTVDSHSTKIGSLETNLATANNNISSVSSKQSALEQNLNGFKQTVSQTYATKTSVTDISNNLKNNYSTTSAMNSAINQKANEITSTVSETYATKTSVTDVSNNLKNNYSTTSAMNTAINQKANEITSSVSQTYATKTSLKATDDKFANYSTTSQMNSAINQKSDSILSTVSNTYTTKADFNNLSIGGTNLIANSAPKSTSGWQQYAGSSGAWTLSLVDCSSSTYGKAIRATSNNAAGGGIHKQPVDYTKLVKNEYYTLSAWIRASKNCRVNFINEYMEHGNIINITTEWKYYSYTDKLTGSGSHSDIIYVTNGVENGMWIEVHSLKLEKGTKSSSWSPAPQDIDNSITAVDNKFVDYSTTSQMNSAINQKANEITSTVSETYATKTALNTVDGKFANYSTTSAMNSAINQKANEITSTVSETYATKTALNTVDGKFANYSTTSAMNSAINQKANEITSSVSETYATKTSVTDVSNNLKNNYSTTSAMNSAINQKANEITSTVSETYATKTALNTVDGKFANYSTTSAMNSAIQQKANEITSAVSETYTTKTEFNGLSIGGRNLLKNTDFIRNVDKDNSINYDSVLHLVDGYDLQSLIGKTLMFSYEVYSPGEYVGSTGITNDTSAGRGRFGMHGSIKWGKSNDSSAYTRSYPFADNIERKFDTKTRVIMKSTVNPPSGYDKILEFTIAVQPHSKPSQNNDAVWILGKPKLEIGNKATDWSPAPEDVNATISAVDNKFVDYSTTSQMNSAINQKANEITSSVSETYATKASLTTVDNKFANYSTTSAMNSAINQKANEITSTVSETYATKTSVTDVSNNLKNNYSTTSAMNSAINQKANEITSSVSETYATKAALNTVDGKFANYSTTSAMNSAINQKANEITSTVSETYATKTSVTDVSNNLKNNYSTTSAMNSAINQKANEITSTISSTYTTKADFNNLNVGGRNFIINSGFKGVVPNTQNFPYWTHWGNVRVFPSQGTGKYNAINTLYLQNNTTTPGGIYQDISSAKIPKNTQITISYDMIKEGNVISSSTSLEFYNTSNTRLGDIRISSSDGHVIKTLMTPNYDYSKMRFVIHHGGSNDNKGGYLVIVGNIKIEKGNRATDWTPAPEDIDNSITAVDGKFTNYSTTSQMNSAINQKANEITSTVSETYATKTALNTVDGKFANYSTTSAMNSAINQKANEITSTVSKTYATKTDFNNLQVGGTNLLPKSGNFKDNIEPWHSNGGPSVTLDSSVTYGGYSTIKIVGATGAYYNGFIQLKPNTTYTYSVLAKASRNIAGGNSNSNPLHMWVSTSQTSEHLEIFIANNSSIGTKWTKAWVTFKTPNDADVYYMRPFIYQIGDATVWLANAKIEEGNKATDWSPAQADIDASITAVDNKFNNYSTTSQMNSAINQKANEITSTVSSLDTKFTTNYANTVISSSTEFYLSTSNTTQINGSWSDVPSDVSQGTFLWSRTKNTKGNGSISYTEPICVTDDTSDGYIIVLSRENQTVYCDANGNPI